MPVKFISFCFLLTVLIVFNTKAQGTSAQQKICGKWECTDKSIRIEVYMQGNEYKANLICLRILRESRWITGPISIIPTRHCVTVKF
jgi:hypothetical protein